MSASFFRFSALCASLSLAALMGSINPAHAASSEIADLDPVDAAKVARQRILQRGPNRLQSAREDSQDNADCGSVNIGNQQDDSARGRINPRNQTVIVTGNIFNTANCR